MSNAQPSSFPNSISSEQLEKFATLAKGSDLENAPSPEDFEQRVLEVISDIIPIINEKCEHQVVAKVLALTLLTNLSQWALSNYQAAKEESDLESSCSFWAIHCQIAQVHNLLLATCLGKSDFPYISTLDMD